MVSTHYSYSYSITLDLFPSFVVTKVTPDFNKVGGTRGEHSVIKITPSVAIDISISYDVVDVLDLDLIVIVISVTHVRSISSPGGSSGSYATSTACYGGSVYHIPYYLMRINIGDGDVSVTSFVLMDNCGLIVVVCVT